MSDKEKLLQEVYSYIISASDSENSTENSSLDKEETTLSSQRMVVYEPLTITHADQLSQQELEFDDYLATDRIFLLLTTFKDMIDNLLQVFNLLTRYQQGYIYHSVETENLKGGLEELYKEFHQIDTTFDKSEEIKNSPLEVLWLQLHTTAFLSHCFRKITYVLRKLILKKEENCTTPANEIVLLQDITNTHLSDRE